MDDEEDWRCPRGHGRLVRRDADGVHHTCDTCHGLAVTIWLLDELLADPAIGGGIWRSSADAPATGGPCPQCAQPMRPVPPPGGPVEGGSIEVCRVCEIVWMDAPVLPRLPGRPGSAAVGTIASPQGTHCPVCGAPYDDYLAGQCRFCKTRIAGPSD